MTETKRVAKRQRVDAGEWVDDAVEQLAKTLGKRLTLTDLPEAIIKYNIMSLLTVSEAAYTFQKGYLILPPALSTKQHSMPTPAEFFVPDHVIERYLNRTTDPAALIGCWERSKVGADVRVLRFSSSTHLSLDAPNLERLLDCFPKATSITICVNLAPKPVLDLLLERKTPLQRLELSHGQHLAAGPIESRTAVPPLLRLASNLVSLHLHHSIWLGESKHVSDLIAAFSRQLESLHCAMASAPTEDQLGSLWKRCPKLTDLQVTAFYRARSTPFLGLLAKTLEGDRRQWRHFGFHCTIPDNHGVSTADLVAVAGEQLESLDLTNIDVSKVDFKVVLAKCPALQVFDVNMESDHKVTRQALTALGESPSAANIIRISENMLLEDVIPTAGDLIQLHTNLPRLEQVFVPPGRVSRELFSLLDGSRHRNALTSLRVGHDSKYVLSSAAVARVFLNSTRWTRVAIDIRMDQPLPQTVLDHLTVRCPDLVEFDVMTTFEGLTGPRLAALMDTMRHGRELQFGEHALEDSKMIADDSIQLSQLTVYSKRPRHVTLHGAVLMRVSAQDIQTACSKQPPLGCRTECIVTRQAAEECEKRFGYIPGRFRPYGNLASDSGWIGHPKIESYEKDLFRFCHLKF